MDEKNQPLFNINPLPSDNVSTVSPENAGPQPFTTFEEQSQKQESDVTPSILTVPEPVAAPAQPNSDLQNILQDHLAWINSGGKDGRRANFRSADLQGIQITNAFLAEASFRGANLNGANISGSDLRGADLSEAILGNTNLSYANLGGAFLNRADLRTAQFTGADLSGADLSGAYLAGGNLTQVNLSGATLLETDLQGVQASQAKFVGANLRGAKLANGHLTGADFSQSNCREANFSQAILDHALFQGASLRNAIVQGASLIGTDLSNAADASADNRQDSVQLEQVQQEWTKLKAEQELFSQQKILFSQREMSFQTDRQQLEQARRELKNETDNMHTLILESSAAWEQHKRHSSILRIFSIIWLVVTLLVAGGLFLFISALDLKSLNVLEVGIVIGGCLAILALFIATTIQSFKLSANIANVQSLYDHQKLTRKAF